MYPTLRIIQYSTLSMNPVVNSFDGSKTLDDPVFNTLDESSIQLSRWIQFENILKMFSNIRPGNVKDFIEIFFMKLIIMKPTALVVPLLMMFLRIFPDHYNYETNQSFDPLTIKTLYKDFVA